MKAINFWLIVLFVGFSVISCSEDDKLLEEPFSPQTYDVQGKVEKGPFVSGSTLSIQPMDSKLQVLGSMFSTAISDDLGNFMLGSKEFSSPYAEFMANGYFFNEVKGELSNGTLTLRALVDLQDNTTVNVNVLTHLKYARIKKLVSSGKSFQEANKQAQKELFEAFGLSEFASKEVASFSILAGTDESAALLAISSLLLMERTEAAFTEYLSKLSADFGKNGKFSKDMLSQISKDKKELAKYLYDIRNNVISRYAELGIAVNVKEPAYFIDWNEDGVAGNELLKENESVNIDKPLLDVPNEGGTYTIKIESPVPVYLEPQVEENLDLEPDDAYVSETIASTLYEGYEDSYFNDKQISCEAEIKESILNIKVEQLESRYEQTKTVNLYDYIGNVVAAVELSQKGRAFNIPVSEAPLLGENGKQIVSGIAFNIARGLRQYNVIEQYYAYNKLNDKVTDYVYPGSGNISNSWSNIYSANTNLLQLKKIEESLLNVYGDYFNVLSALYYSNLIYGWDAVPYITDYSMLEQIVNEGIHRETTTNIFNDLKKKLSNAIDNVAEKKNESLKDINGFFFVSKDVARVLLANIHMYQGNYNEAKNLLKKVIDNGFYTLDASTNFRPSTTTESIDVAESTEVIFAFVNENESVTRSGVTIVEPGVMPYITLSDVYLSYAECLLKSGEENTANEYISKIIEAKNLTLTETDVLMKIKEVREQILLYSGTYFAFLKRTGLAKEVCNIEDYQLLFPIPQSELNFNNKMTQNSGY